MKMFKAKNVVLGCALLSGALLSVAAGDGNGRKAGEAQPHSHVKSDGGQPAAGTATPTGLTVAQIRQAYGFDQLFQVDPSINGAGQTIAIIDAFGDRYAKVTTTSTGHGNKTTSVTNIVDSTQTDWATFCAQFGLPTTGLTVATPQGVGPVSTGWALETALDIEWAHAIAPAANILLVVAYDNSNAKLYDAVDYAVSQGATVVSMSFGSSESSGELASDLHFQHPGVTFVASAGDSGEAVEYPAASPYVVGVGGTDLSNSDPVGFTGTWSENAWSGSGGGISLYEGMPGFQNGWQQFDTGNKRSVPDVSYTGGTNNMVSVYLESYGGWIRVYGTSVGAPQWAALIALANSKAVSGANAANSLLYSLGTASSQPPPYVNPDNFRDIISGSNDTDPDDFAVPGYDFVTGVGSPKAQNLVPALITLLNTWDFILSITPASATVNPGGGTATYSLSISGVGGFTDTVGFTIDGLPAGTTASFSPNPTSSSTTLTVTVAPNTAAGSYPFFITGTASSDASRSHTTSAILAINSSPTAVYVTQPSGSSGYSVSGGKNNSANLTIQVLLRNDFGAAVGGATVATTIYLNGAVYGSASATTDATGAASFVARNAPPGTYSTVVTSVTASGLAWNGLTPANSYTKR